MALPGGSKASREATEERARQLEAWRQLSRGEVLALKATAFDLWLSSIPTVRNPFGNEEAAERAERILALPLPPEEGTE